MKLGEYYEAYPDTHCDGAQYHIKQRADLKTLAPCIEACDSTPGCVTIAVLDDWSDGCWLKTGDCIEGLHVSKGSDMYVKPSKFF